MIGALSVRYPEKASYKYNVAGVKILSMYFNTYYYRYSVIATFVEPIKSINSLSAIHIYYCQTLITHAIYQLIQLIKSNCISLSFELHHLSDH